MIQNRRMRRWLPSRFSGGGSSFTFCVWCSRFGVRPRWHEYQQAVIDEFREDIERVIEKALTTAVRTAVVRGPHCRRPSAPALIATAEHEKADLIVVGITARDYGACSSAALPKAS